ncbi:MAG: 2-hydroxychromene-2-carboxylate isomerase [bacterium]|nr:2-hydroxychromene-2-carboxylate isomerase [bacterium]MCP5065032.1 2-hydroxychromene-2-carboxylate isomerase [bacterium]
MMKTLEFFFDYGSPYSYMADTQLVELRDRTGSELVYRPMLLGGVFKATGNQSPAMQAVEAKRIYGGVELRRFVAHYRIAFEANPAFPINTLLLMRTAHAAMAEGVFPAFHAVVYPAFWAGRVDLGQVGEIVRVLEGAGLDGTALVAAAGQPEPKASLRATTDEAVERGVFGAPTFFVGDEMFFGADRLSFVEAALQR